MVKIQLEAVGDEAAWAVVDDAVWSFSDDLTRARVEIELAEIGPQMLGAEPDPDLYMARLVISSARLAGATIVDHDPTDPVKAGLVF